MSKILTYDQNGKLLITAQDKILTNVINNQVNLSCLIFITVIILALLAYSNNTDKEVNKTNSNRLTGLTMYANANNKEVKSTVIQEHKTIDHFITVNIKDIVKLSNKESKVVEVCRKFGINDNRQIASILAQIKIETNDFNLVEEAYYLNNPIPYRSRYGGYHGRGLIQLTWKSNYKNWSEWLGVDLVNNPNILTNNFELNAEIACKGIKNGSFTGSVNGNLDSYINNTKVDYYNSRSLVNGDKNYTRNGKLIGNILVEYAQDYYNKLTQ